jgi:hypothetical protein
MIATHEIRITYFVSEEGRNNEGVRLTEMARWKLLLGDALESVEVEKLG